MRPGSLFHSLSLLFVLGWISAPCPARADATVFVAPSGDDNADGSAARPFASLERARDAVRALRKANTAREVSVVLEAGNYPRKSSFVLTAEDSGTDLAPVTWRAANPGTATLDGGVYLQPGSFREVTEDAARLAPEARGHVLWTDLRGLGVSHKGPYPLNFDNGGGLAELYCNAERMPLSRWPNDGPAKMERVVDKGLPIPGQAVRTGRFIAREERVARWAVARGVWLEGYWRVPWDNRTVKVSSIDPATREITLAAPVVGGIGSKYAGPEGSGMEPWWAVNLVEEIDKPGEWAVDFENGRLYWWPPENWKGGAPVLADLSEPLVVFEKARHIRWVGFGMKYNLGHAVELRDSSGVEVAGCRVQNVGGSGVVVQKGARNTVRSCDISDTGHSGIVMGGGNRATLTPAGHLAENNHIYRVGVLKRTYAPGILVGIFGAGDAVGCRIAHNYIHDVPHGGIQYGGNDNLFEYNEISHAVLTSDDMGAFYTTNDWTSCGNILRHNFVHHSPHAVSFYMDDGDGGDTIFGNVSYEMQSGPSVCGGHHNTVRNNIVVRSKRGLFMDARGIARGYDKSSPLYRKLNAVPFQDPVWAERFPYLRLLPDSDTRLPMGNVVSGNVTARCEQAVRIAAKPDEVRLSVFGGNLDLGDRDPGFVDEPGGGLGLRPDSVVYREMPGFEQIPFDLIGLYRDEHRFEIPARQLSNP